MPDVEQQKRLIEEQRNVLNFALSSAHLFLDLIDDIRRVLLVPLADLDVTGMNDEDLRIVVDDSRKVAKTFVDRIEFALTTQVEIEQHMTSEAQP